MTVLFCQPHKKSLQLVVGMMCEQQMSDMLSPKSNQFVYSLQRNIVRTHKLVSAIRSGVAVQALEFDCEAFHSNGWCILHGLCQDQCTNCAQYLLPWYSLPGVCDLL